MNEVVRIKADLDKAHDARDGEKVLELLQLLVNMPISTQVLQDTHIGATVNAIRKTLEHPEAVALSKKVVKKWKKLVEVERQTIPSDAGKGSKKTETPGAGIKDSTSSGGNNNNNGSNSNGPASTNNSNSNFNNTSSNSGDAADRVSPTEIKQEQSQTRQDSSAGAEESGASGASAKGARREVTTLSSRPSFVAKEIPQTSSTVRLKFRQMITEALKQPLPKELQTNEPFLDEESLAARIEDCVYQEFKSDTDSRYRNRVRGRISNLKDKNNPYLRLQVLRGDISVERMARMTPEEMASDELKRQREQFHREAINDHQMALTGGTRSSEIKCPACKKYDCSYNQMQTRSADEPMTTFCHCNNCGKRWKFC